MTRRTFLRRSAAASALAAALPWGSRVRQADAAQPAGDPGAHLGMLVDLTRCIGCRACVRACDDRNGLPKADRPATAWDGPDEPLTYAQWTVVNLEDRIDHATPIPVKRQCLHCLDPACVSVCPVGAMRRLPSGAVVYRAERCIGCRYCMIACPFGIPKFEWSAGTDPVIGKCQFCAQHARFQGPACAAACPTGALKFGAREPLLVEARARVHARSDRYIDHIYGEREAGGTSWLYLSGRPFARLGFPREVPCESLPSLTRWALHLVPWVVTVLAVALSALAAFSPHRKRPSRGSAPC